MIWVLEDPRAGTAAQALGMAERLGQPFRRVPLRFGRLAGLPWPWPTLAGLADRTAFTPPWPSLVFSAGRRSAPVSRWLRARGARTVHAMRPGLGAADFDLLVIGAHDHPAPAPNVMLIQGAAHRLTPEALAAARASFPDFATLPHPIVTLLLGGPVRAEGMDPACAARIASTAAQLGGSLLVTTSRRTGAAATQAVADTLQNIPHLLYPWGASGANPYAAMLAMADILVVTGDSISMLSEALMTTSPLLIADPGGLGARHQAVAQSLIAAGLAARLGDPLPPPRLPRDETARIAAEIRARGWA
ncbi:mitochondrial fission ELM1 family protein [Sediminicoccus sp. KRV36]|uniref:mitochondrial fission ELM1 family protein n=1 Tax=Sediminicoccus sp. KRV36 TaxID=3133721 RepID=UPI00200D11AF|nr:mitochondrial fission ELM1 family protein [Sediminicoccus rosea]UPY39179.1 mitochondrial fission ELM1 family protein [Sediminicoccus rosea]